MNTTSTPRFDPRFAINFSCQILPKNPFSPDEDDPFASLPFDVIDTVRDEVVPIFLETGFIEKTGLSQLVVFIIAVDDSQPANNITYLQRKKDRALWCDLTFHREELESNINGEFRDFMVRQLAYLLQDICNEYSLNSEPVERLLSRYQGEISRLNPAAISCSRAEDTTEELIIHIKLPDDSFGSADSFIKNVHLSESIAHILEQTEMGRLDGSEIGDGYETLFCIGPNAEAMRRILSQHLCSLPTGSYLETYLDGEIRQLKLDGSV